MFLDPEGSRGANDPSSQTQAALDNKHNMEQREQYYATVRKPGQQSPCREVSALERIPEYSEDIYPYATFNLPEQENLSANPMRQAFFYERSETMLQGAQVRFFPLSHTVRGAPRSILRDPFDTPLPQTRVGPDEKFPPRRTTSQRGPAQWLC